MIAFYWYDPRTWLAEGSYRVGIAFEFGWKSGLAPGWEGYRTLLEETSMPVGKETELTVFVSNICGLPWGLLCFTDYVYL